MIKALLQRLFRRSKKQQSIMQHMIPYPVISPGMSAYRLMEYRREKIDAELALIPDISDLDTLILPIVDENAPTEPAPAVFVDFAADTIVDRNATRPIPVIV